MGGEVVRAPKAPVVLSTASVYPESTPAAFEIASHLGYDGVEVMVSTDVVSQDAQALRRLSDYHRMPIRAVHAPCLLLTKYVWGRDPWVKLRRTREVAEEVGAPTVVVHPPFRWQRDYARDFHEGLARMQADTDVALAVENMFPLRAGGREVVPYSPGWSPVDEDYPHVVLDLSHAAVSRSDPLVMAEKLGDRLRHIHFADSLGATNKDEHLIPGRGSQPCAEFLEWLATAGFDGSVVVEVSTRWASGRGEREADLAAGLAFARLNFVAPQRTPWYDDAVGGDFAWGAATTDRYGEP